MDIDNPVGAVIIGSDFQALGIVRSLAEKNVPVFLIEHELGISRFSRYVKRRNKNYSLLSPDKFTDYMIEIAKKEKLEGWVLYPNNDEIVKLISINRDRLQDWYRVPVPDWEVVKKFYYKQNSYRIAESISIPIPKFYDNGSIEELEDSNLEFPIVLKPAFKEGYFPVTKRKALRINNKNELIKEYNKMASIIDSSNIVIQEMIDGGTKNLYSFFTFFDGRESISGMSARRLRQHPMDFGTATYAESVKIPEIEVMSTKLLKEIGYFGIAEVEFMRDDNENTFKFIEINGRIWGQHTIAKAAGINLPYMVYQHMIGNKVEPIEPDKDVKWIRLITDVPTVLRELISGRMKLKEYFISLKGNKEYAVFSLKDPLPFLMEFILIPYLYSKRGF